MVRFLFPDRVRVGSSRSLIECIRQAIFHYEAPAFPIDSPGSSNPKSKLPNAYAIAKAADSQALAPLITASVRAGDAVLVKGSLGSRMAVLVTALQSVDRALPRAANGD